MKKVFLSSILLLCGVSTNAQQLLEVLKPRGTDLTDSKCIERVKDKHYGDGLHNFIYCAVQGPNGKKWLNHNLGAEYAREGSKYFNPEAQPTGHNDWKAFGSLFQEGRKADGHELVDYLHKNIEPNFHYNDRDNTDNWYVLRKTNVRKYPIDPIHSDSHSFIWGEDWMTDRSNIHNLWDGEMLNNPCPNGYRIMNDRDIMALFVDDHTKMKRDVNQGYRTAAVYHNLDYPNLIIMTAPCLLEPNDDYRDILQKTSTGYSENSGATSSLWLSTRLDKQLNYDLDNPLPGWQYLHEFSPSEIRYYYGSFDTGVLKGKENPGMSTVGVRPAIFNASYAIRCVEK